MIILSRDIITRQFLYGNIVNIGCFDKFIAGAVNVDILSMEEIRSQSKKPDLVIPNFIQADAHDLSMLHDKEFDCALLSEVIEHVDDPIKVLDEVQRISKTLVFDVPNEYEWHPQYKPFWNPGHKRFFTEESLIKLCEDSGIFIIEFIKASYVGWSFFIIVGKSKYANFKGGQPLPISKFPSLMNNEEIKGCVKP